MSIPAQKNRDGEENETNIRVIDEIKIGSWGFKTIVIDLHIAQGRSAEAVADFAVKIKGSKSGLRPIITMAKTFIFDRTVS